MTDEEWALGDYVHEPCPNCGRARLCECDNGKHRCEKCNWSPELNDYVVVDPLGEYSDLFGEDNDA
jgi:ribosomal protein L37AE/L43A